MTPLRKVSTFDSGNTSNKMPAQEILAEKKKGLASLTADS